MKRSATYHIAGTIVGIATGAVCCNGIDASGEVGGFGASGAAFGVAATGGAIPGTGGSSADPPPLQEPSSSTLPDMPQVAGAAGLGGEGGAGGREGSQSAPTPPEGALLAGIWDDNLNFAWFQELLETRADGGQLSFDHDEHVAASERARDTSKAHQTLDIALIVDTTGSMGDELSYLQKSLGALWQAIALDYPDAEQRWALVAYRDEGDNYLSNAFEFMTRKQEFESVLLDQRAEGGGDRPEATHQALLDMLTLSWRPGDSNARLAFWVTDAPHHPEKADLVEQALLIAQQADIRIYPIASTNVDAFTAHALRVTAQLTGGRYLFLVDPEARTGAMTATTPPCFYVTELGAALLRIIGIEMEGRYQPPSPDSLLATHGAPVAGQCSPSALAY